MMQFALWLKGTAFSLMLQNVLWMVPAIQTVHILAIAVLTVSVAMIGLRVLGATKGYETTPTLIHRLRPWTWTGLCVLVITGLLLFIEEPDRLLADIGFQIKMALLVLAIPATIIADAAAQRANVTGNASHGVNPRVASVATLTLWL